MGAALRHTPSLRHRPRPRLATAGYSASTVDAGQRGVGFLLHEGDTPTRCRGFHLSDADLAAIAERAAQLPRSNHDEDSVGGNDADDESDEQAPS